MMNDTIPDYLSDVLKDFATIAVGPCFNLASHAKIGSGRGWYLDEIEYSEESTPKWIPNQLMDLYEDFKNRNLGPPERLEFDIKKIALSRAPSVMEKWDKLNLKWTTCLYSEMRFYQTRIGYTIGYENIPASVEEYRLRPEERINALRLYAKELLEEGNVTIPSSLSIHALVETKDGKIIIPKRGPDVAYFPSKWNITFDENVRYQEDYLDVKDKDFIGNCIVRGLKEELLGGTIKEETFVERHRIQIISVFVEGNLPSIGIFAYVPLILTSSEVEVYSVNRPDYQESRRLKFVPSTDLNWSYMKNEEYFDNGWGWATQFILFMWKVFRGDKLEDAFT